MTRKEILNAAKAAGIKEVNGVNFTRCSNDVLLAEMQKLAPKKATPKAENKAEKKYNTEVKQPVDRKQLMAQLKSVGLTTINGVSYTRCSNEVLQQAWENHKLLHSTEVLGTTALHTAKADSIDTATNKKEAAKPKAKVIDVQDAYKACFLTALTLLDSAGLLDDLVKAIKVHP